MDSSLRPYRAEGLQWCTLDEGALVTDPATRESWSLNPVGWFIWAHCDGDRDVGQLEIALRMAFGIDARTAATDLEEYLLDLEQLGLLQLAWPAAG